MESKTNSRKIIGVRNGNKTKQSLNIKGMNCGKIVARINQRNEFSQMKWK